jgi:hypothetical protein
MVLGPAIEPLAPETDQAMAAFRRLKTRLLDSTLIVWMGGFGRTPRISNEAGGTIAPPRSQRLDRRRH